MAILLAWRFLSFLLQDWQFLLIRFHFAWCVGFPGGSVVKNLPARQEMQVSSLGREDPWRRLWQPTQYSCLENIRQRSLVGSNPWGCKRAGHHLATKRQTKGISSWFFPNEKYFCLHCRERSPLSDFSTQYPKLLVSAY